MAIFWMSSTAGVSVFPMGHALVNGVLCWMVSILREGAHVEWNGAWLYPACEGSAGSRAQRTGQQRDASAVGISRAMSSDTARDGDPFPCHSVQAGAEDGERAQDRL